MSKRGEASLNSFFFMFDGNLSKLGAAKPLAQHLLCLHVGYFISMAEREILHMQVQMRDYEQVELVLAIECTCTFEDLHFALLDALGYPPGELASFYLCSDNWQPQIEISLVDMKFNDEDALPIPLMKDVQLCEYLQRTNQKLIYEYDYTLNFGFRITVGEVTPPAKGIAYPLLISTKGKVPSYDKAKKALAEDISSYSNDALSSFKDLLDDEDSDDVDFDDFDVYDDTRY